MLTRCYDVDWDVEANSYGIKKVTLWNFSSDVDLTDILNDSTIEALEEAYWEERAAGEG